MPVHATGSSKGNSMKTLVSSGSLATVLGQAPCTSRRALDRVTYTRAAHPGFSRRKITSNRFAAYCQAGRNDNTQQSGAPSMP